MEESDTNDLVSLNINGDVKICGIKKNTKYYNKNSYNKRLSKKDVEKLLVEHGIKDGNKISARQARKIRLKDGCNILKNVFPSVIIKANNLDKEFFKYTKDYGLKRIEGVNCHTNKKINPNSLSHTQLKEIAQGFGINYKGTKKEICKRLNKIGLEFLDDNENIEQLNEANYCYKLNKQNCQQQDDNCDWIIERKQILIDRLILLDLLEENNHDPEEYQNLSVRNLQNELKNRGFLDPNNDKNYMSPTLHSRCIPNNKKDEVSQKQEMLKITKHILQNFKNRNIVIEGLRANLPNFKSDLLSKKYNKSKYEALINIYYILHPEQTDRFNLLQQEVARMQGGSNQIRSEKIVYNYDELLKIINELTLEEKEKAKQLIKDQTEEQAEEVEEAKEDVASKPHEEAEEELEELEEAKEEAEEGTQGDLAFLVNESDDLETENTEEAAEQARKEAEEAAEKAKAEEAAEKAKAEEAAEKARKEAEAAEEAKAAEAAEKARKEAEAAEKARKEAEAAEKARKEAEEAKAAEQAQAAELAQEAVIKVDEEEARKIVYIDDKSFIF